MSVDAVVGVAVALEVQTLAEFLATCFGLDASRVHVATEFYWAFVAPPEEA